MQEQRFSYVVRARTFVMLVLTGLGLIVLCGYAYLNNWGISLYGAGLEPAIAQWFYLGLVGLGVLVLILGIVAMSAGRREVVVAPERLHLPKGEYSRTVVDIDPDQIRDLSMSNYQGVQTLIVTHPDGKVRLRSPHFASPADFAACVSAIEAARHNS